MITSGSPAAAIRIALRSTWSWKRVSLWQRCLAHGASARERHQDLPADAGLHVLLGQIAERPPRGALELREEGGVHRLDGDLLEADAEAPRHRRRVLAGVVRAVAGRHRHPEDALGPERLGGDALAAPDRQRAERVFGRPVFEVYGTTETSVLGLVEPRSEGMVLLEDDVWIEIEADRLLVTHLTHRTTPLIRYVISDTVIPSSQTGFAHYRGFRRIQSIAGRREDNLVLRNESGVEDFIHPLLIVEFYVPGIDRAAQQGVRPFDVVGRVVSRPPRRPNAPRHAIVNIRDTGGRSTGRRRRASWNGPRRRIAGPRGLSSDAAMRTLSAGRRGAWTPRARRFQPTRTPPPVSSAASVAFRTRLMSNCSS